MSYERHIELNKMRENMRLKLVSDGLTPENAEKSANLMSEGNLQQVQKDLMRHPKIKVINKKTGETLEFSSGEIANDAAAEKFLRMISNSNEKLYQYLIKYLHQGGFLHLSELMMTYFFAPDTILATDHRVATFTIQTDDSLSYEERFDIKKISSSSGEYEPTDGTSITTIALESTIKCDKNNIEHQYGELKIKAHDLIASKFINDPRNGFVKFLERLKNILSSFFSRIAREQNQQRDLIPPPRRKI